MKTIVNTTIVAMLVLSGVMMAAFTGCTENERARSFGGETVVNVPAGQKVIGATWKETDLWYLTRPMRADEQPENLTLHESSTYGVWEGRVVFAERK